MYFSVGLFLCFFCCSNFEGSRDFLGGGNSNIFEIFTPKFKTLGEENHPI